MGLTLALETARRLKLKQHDTEILAFLVHRHLLMSHLAFRRDTGEEAVIVQFAATVGSPEMLRMLLILTCADLAAVGPDVLNQWKIQVLAELYHRSLAHLSGMPIAEVNDRLEEVRRLAVQTVPRQDAQWFSHRSNRCPRPI